MNAAGLLRGMWAWAPTAPPWLGGGLAIALATAVAALAVAGGALYWRRRVRNGRAAVPPDPAREIRECLRRRLAEPAEAFALPVAGPTVGAGETVEADLEAAALQVLPQAGWRRSTAKHLLRRQLNGHAAPGSVNGSEAARWRQLGALALIDDARDALAAYARAADLAPDDAELQLLLGVLNLRTGRLEVAEATFRRQLELAGATDGAEAVRYQAGIMLGDVLLAKGAREAALGAYETARTSVLALAEREPDNPRWRRDASVTHDRIGDWRLADGQPDLALESFRRSLEIAEALAGGDPPSPARQHDLSVAHDRIGEALELKGDLDGALQSYRRGLALAEALTEREPECTDWRWDVSVSLDRIGDVLAAKGKASKALSAYRRGLKIAGALAVGDRSRLEWQRDLAVSCHKVGLLEAEAGHEAEALEVLEQGRAIIARLAEIARYQAQWRADLVKFDIALKDLRP